MTRKDFVLIADTLKATVPPTPSDPKNLAAIARYATWTAVTMNMADALASTNPTFDRARFLTAAGVV